MNHSKRVDVQMSEVNAKLEPVKWGHETLYADGSSKDEQLLLILFFVKKKKQKHERQGRLKVKLHMLFYADNS